MPKRNNKSAVHNLDDSPHHASKLSALRGEGDLYYKIKVLLYDLCNVASDPQSMKRISITTHELYISDPYFSEIDAVKIRTALLDEPLEATEPRLIDDENPANSSDSIISPRETTVEVTIHNQLANFFEKRKASGDARPCGPHDMLPVYMSVFGVTKEELKDEKFLSRLRRDGLGEVVGKEKSVRIGKGEKARKKGK